LVQLGWFLSFAQGLEQLERFSHMLVNPIVESKQGQVVQIVAFQHQLLVPRPFQLSLEVLQQFSK
jgi:hypothetical protein